MSNLKKAAALLTTFLYLAALSSAAYADCEFILPDGTVYNGIETGLGCIPTEPTGLATFFVELSFATVSGIALLLLIYGGFKVLTSSGDPKAVGEGRETITSALAGLILVLFSVAILRIIGYNILGIPFFNP